MDFEALSADELAESDDEPWDSELFDNKEDLVTVDMEDVFGAVGLDQGDHIIQHRIGRRRAGQAVMDAFRLFTIIRPCRLQTNQQRENANDKQFIAGRNNHFFNAIERIKR